VARSEADDSPQSQESDRMPITITVRKNGSLGINAEDAAQIVLVDSAGNVIPPRAEGRPMSLCRCGHSKIKPFCDSSHKEFGFIDPTDPMDAPGAPVP
jgi:CDGSH-type Zn-finger protein